MARPGRRQIPHNAKRGPGAQDSLGIQAERLCRPVELSKEAMIGPELPLSEHLGRLYPLLNS